MSYSLEEDIRNFVEKIASYRNDEREDNPLKSEDRIELGDAIGKNLGLEYAANVITLLEKGEYGGAIRYAEQLDEHSEGKIEYFKNEFGEFVDDSVARLEKLRDELDGKKD